jgi:hypothetical protein
MDKWTLVIPGMIEWRWLLEESQYHSNNSTESDNFESNTTNQVEMANLFQSIHERLTEPFSDAQIQAAEIFKYAQLLFTSGSPPTQKAAQAHYSYFKLGLLVYYGNYPKQFLDSGEYSDNHEGGDLKKMRERLGQLRQDLIQSMIQ